MNIKLEKEDLTIEYDSDDNICTVQIDGQCSKGYTKEELVKNLFSLYNTLANL